MGKNGFMTDAALKTVTARPGSTKTTFDFVTSISALRVCLSHVRSFGHMQRCVPQERDEHPSESATKFNGFVDLQ